MGVTVGVYRPYIDDSGYDGISEYVEFLAIKNPNNHLFHASWKRGAGRMTIVGNDPLPPQLYLVLKRRVLP